MQYLDILPCTMETTLHQGDNHKFEERGIARNISNPNFGSQNMEYSTRINNDGVETVFQKLPVGGQC